MFRPLTIPVAKRVVGDHEGKPSSKKLPKGKEHRQSSATERKRGKGSPGVARRKKRTVKPSASRARPVSRSDWGSDESVEQFAQLMTRDVSIKELEAERRALDQ